LGGRRRSPSPRVESLPEHASKTIEEYDPTLSRLEYEERIELISLVIDGASRSVPDYLQRAAAHESFARDVGQLLLEATRQRIRLDDLDDPHDCLAFLYAMNDRFHAEIDDRGYVERADVIPQAVERLEANADELRTRVTGSFDAVLAVEFEEYRRLDRRYLAALTRNADLVCVGERHASVERTRVEPGRIDDIATDAGLAVETLDPETVRNGDTDTEPPHQPIAQFSPRATLRFDLPPSATGGATGRRLERQSTTHPYWNRPRADPGGRDRDPVASRPPRLVLRRVRRRRSADRTGSRDQAAAPRRRRPDRDDRHPSLAEDPAVNELYAVVTCQCERERDGDGLERIDPAEPTRDRAIRERSPWTASGPETPIFRPTCSLKPPV